MKANIKPCPFCGPTATVNPPARRDGKDHMVTCWNCMCDGPRAKNEVEAIAAWNARPSPWIACSDRMPEAGLYVLASVLGGDLHVAKCRNGFWFDWRLYDHAVTHRMPLPKDPDENKKDGAA